MTIVQKRKKKKREFEETGAQQQRQLKRQSRIQRTKGKS